MNELMTHTSMYMLCNNVFSLGIACMYAGAHVTTETIPSHNIITGITMHALYLPINEKCT